MALPRYPKSSAVFFVRCQLFDNTGKLLVDNSYWQSQKDDDLGGRSNDFALNLKQVRWADMTALNTMSPVRLEVSAERFTADGQTRVTIHLRNSSEHIAFFERATITASEGGDEILPIQYDDNYITVYPGESTDIHGTVAKAASSKWVRLEGYNTPPASVTIK